MPNEAHPSDRCYDMNWNKRYHSSYSIQINKCMGESLQWQTGLWIINVYGNAVDHLSTHFIFFLCVVPCSHSAHRSMFWLSLEYVVNSYFWHCFHTRVHCVFVCLQRKLLLYYDKRKWHRKRKKIYLNLIQVFWLWLLRRCCVIAEKNEESKKTVCIENPSKH